ncbi:MAG: hypothetical protein KKF56_02560 [Nanoarchaeota archaeon]|nr:hypothetical protein [Nanoarchaeota archaeon]
MAKNIGSAEAGRALLVMCRSSVARVAQEASEKGTDRVFVPTDLTSVEGREVMADFLSHPEAYDLTGGNDNASEPLYADLVSAREGRNADGTPHNGYLAVSVSSSEVVAAYDGQGREISDKFRQTPEVGPFSPRRAAQELLG